LNTNPITYKLTEFDGSPIEGSFYASEMIKTAVPDYYEVEKVDRILGSVERMA